MLDIFLKIWIGHGASYKPLRIENRVTRIGMKCSFRSITNSEMIYMSNIHSNEYDDGGYSQSFFVGEADP